MLEKNFGKENMSDHQIATEQQRGWAEQLLADGKYGNSENSFLNTVCPSVLQKTTARMAHLPYDNKFMIDGENLTEITSKS